MTTEKSRSGFDRSAVIATVAIGAGIGCLNALQPILLGSMLDAGRISVTQIGQSATAELAGMALATTAAAFRLAPVELRRRALMALALMLVANLATPALYGVAVLGARFANGLGTGLLFWMLVGLIGRSASPARLFAIYVTVQATGALLLSMLLSSVVVPRFGPWGGYAALGLIDLALLALAAPRIPSSYPVSDSQVGGLPPTAGLFGLAAVGCLVGGMMALWVYALPLFRALGHSDGVAHSAISVSIACQIAGGLASSLLSERMRPLVACIVGPLLCILGILAVLGIRGDLALYAAMAVYGFCWMGVPPFQMPLLIRLDPSLRTVLLIGSAQMLGLALSPVLASAVIRGQGVIAAAWVAIAFLLVSVASLLIAVFTARATALSSRPEPAP